MSWSWAAPDVFSARLGLERREAELRLWLRRRANGFQRCNIAIKKAYVSEQSPNFNSRALMALQLVVGHCSRHSTS